MSLAIAWSYFHRLREPGSNLPQHFVVIAPNLTVYERLKDDFENCAIFYQDPVIPRSGGRTSRCRWCYRTSRAGAPSQEPSI